MNYSNLTTSVKLPLQNINLLNSVSIIWAVSKIIIFNVMYKEFFGIN